MHSFLKKLSRRKKKKDLAENQIRYEEKEDSTWERGKGNPMKYHERSTRITATPWM